MLLQQVLTTFDVKIYVV